jgi:hypothetical protein
VRQSGPSLHSKQTGCRFNPHPAATFKITLPRSERSFYARGANLPDLDTPNPNEALDHGLESGDFGASRRARVAKTKQPRGEGTTPGREAASSPALTQLALDASRGYAAEPRCPPSKTDLELGGLGGAVFGRGRRESLGPGCDGVGRPHCGSLVEKMAVTKDKLASLLFYGVIVALAAAYPPSWGMPGFGVVVALAVSLLGLALIWFAEPLSETGCFSRGVPLSSPPQLIGVLGWLFLAGYPLLLFILMRTAPAWAH